MIDILFMKFVKNNLMFVFLYVYICISIFRFGFIVKGYVNC